MQLRPCLRRVDRPRSGRWRYDDPGRNCAALHLRHDIVPAARIVVLMPLWLLVGRHFCGNCRRLDLFRYLIAGSSRCRANGKNPCPLL